MANRRNRIKSNKIHVPYYGIGNPALRLLEYLVTIIFLHNYVLCHNLDRPQSSIQFQYFDPTPRSESHDLDQGDGGQRMDFDWSVESAPIVAKRTPPLKSSPRLNRGNLLQAKQDIFTENHSFEADYEATDIRPERIYMNYGGQQELYSPIFNYQLTNPFAASNLGVGNIEVDRNQPAGPQIPFGSSNQLDKSGDGNYELNLVDQGSGDGYIDQPAETPFNVPDMIPIDGTPNIIPTPSLEFGDYTSALQHPNMNRAPKLNKRIPKLSITAGQGWRYLIPYDIFIDEDGDLRNLNSTITIKSHEPLKLSQSDQDPVDGDDRLYYSWLQYNPTQKLLYGLPSEKDAGLHRVSLLVADRWGAMSEETIEIYVKQHPSVRAFNHLFTLHSITWDKRRWTSMVDAVGELMKRISESVLIDEPFRNSIVQFYELDKPDDLDHSKTDDNPRSESTGTGPQAFSLGWSNSSISVVRCNLDQIKAVMRSLAYIDTIQLSDSFRNLHKRSLGPSEALTKALGPEFTPSSVSFTLGGVCMEKLDESIVSEPQKIMNGHETTSEVKIKTNRKIGKLTWKLGEPIDYKIPIDVFSIEPEVQSNYPIELSLHTIEGLSLDKDPRYNFMEFDPVTRTLLGLPYDQDLHAGQKELRLTGYHPKSGEKGQEVIVVTIEPQDLSIVNNRAFKLSLYMTSRGGIFGPRERVNLSRKLAAVFDGNNIDFSHEHELASFLVLAVQRMAVRSTTYAGDYNDKVIYKLSDALEQRDELSLTREAADEIVYKFSWTNETIGYKGNCPVEVIRDNIMGALERQMFDLELSDDRQQDELQKNNSDRFHERLNFYFEPDIKVIDLRFEPIAACAGVMDLSDVGNNELADQIDKVLDEPLSPEPITPHPQLPVLNTKLGLEPSSDEYWSIVVLIILVIALIFVIVMFFLGMHTYKINQDKRFELQVKLSQARQNSMFLSSMMLANNQATAQFESQLLEGQPVKSVRQLALQQDDDGFARRPVILDSEKQSLMQNGGFVDMKPTSVQLEGHSVMTRPVKSDTRFTLDSLVGGNWNSISFADRPMLNGHNQQLDTGLNQRSMTIGHRARGASMQRFMVSQPAMMSQSPSVLTVGSNLGSVQLMRPMGQMPEMYAAQANYSSLQRNYTTRSPYEPEAGKVTGYVTTGDIASQSQHKQHSANKSNDSVARFTAGSPFYANSASGLIQSKVSQASYTII